MKKAILVIDMPSRCKDCPLCVSKEVPLSFDEYYCVVENLAVDAYDKLEWCPLKPAPEEVEVMWGSDAQEYQEGYNACIENILDK